MIKLNLILIKYYIVINKKKTIAIRCSKIENNEKVKLKVENKSIQHVFRFSDSRRWEVLGRNKMED